MSVTPVDLVSPVMGGPFHVGLDTIYNFKLTPQIMGELIELYGRGVGLKDIITFSGNVIDIASHEYEVHSQGAILNYITTGAVTAVSGAAGAVITINVDDDANGDQLLQLNDVVLIPGEYVDAAVSTSPAKYQVTAVTDNGADVDFTCTPLLAATELDVAIPAGTALMVTLGNYAPGTAGGNARKTGWYQSKFYTAIKKAAIEMGGSMQSTQRYQDTMKNGQPGMWSVASVIADFTLDAAISDELLVGVVPDNPLAVQADFNGVDRVVRGTKGLWPHLVDDGMLQEYIEDYSISDFDDVSEGFESQGVLSRNAVFCMGGDLYRGLENSGLEFITEFSGGTDLMKQMGALGIEFRTIKKNGITFAIVKLDTFSNPFSYGLSTYNWKKYGFIVPGEYAMVRNVNGSDAIELSNLTLAYKNYNGENRTRVYGVQNGMSGRHPNGSLVSQWDADAGEFLSEFALVATKVNQMIRVQPAAEA